MADRSRRRHLTGEPGARQGRRGTASDLLLLLWRRKTPGSLQTFGNTAGLGRFLAAATLD